MHVLVSQAAEGKVSSLYTGEQDSSCALAMRRCDPKGPLMINVVKLYSSPEGDSFQAFGRIYSGSIQNGDQVTHTPPLLPNTPSAPPLTPSSLPDFQVRILGENYTLQDEEDMAVCTVTSLSVPQGRFRLELNRARAGNWVLLEGVDGPINKTATITCKSGNDDAAIFRPLNFNTLPVIKLAVEPLNPAELPKMVEGLRKIRKSYPAAQTKVHTHPSSHHMHVLCLCLSPRHAHQPSLSS